MRRGIVWFLLAASCSKPPPLETATISVASDPEGAQVFLDGRDVGAVTPTVLRDLPVGREVVIEVRKRAAIPFPAEERVTFREGGEHRSVHFLFETARVFRLVTKPNGARATFNGTELPGRTPFELPAMRRISSATVTVAADGHLPGKIIVRGSATSSVVELELEPAQQIEVITEPVAARVLVDGVLAGTAPVIAAVPLERKFVLRAERLGYKIIQRTLSPEKLKSRLTLKMEELPLAKMPLTKQERGDVLRAVAERERARRSLAAARASLEKAKKRAEAAQRQRAWINTLAEAESAVDDLTTRVGELEQELEEADNAVEELRGHIFGRLDQEEQKKGTKASP